MIVGVGLVIAFVLVVILANRPTRSCRWREVRSGQRDGEMMFRCASCGAEVFTSESKAPSDCHAPHKR